MQKNFWEKIVLFGIFIENNNLMSKIVRLEERDITRLVKKIMVEQSMKTNTRPRQCDPKALMDILDRLKDPNRMFTLQIDTNHRDWVIITDDGKKPYTCAARRIEIFK